jgi:very-short-patch-repair endonuclease
MRPARPFFRYRRDLNYVAGFYCARHRLVIELDGDSHFTDAAERYDKARADALAVYRIVVIRFTNTEVMQQFEAVCEKIDETLASCFVPKN